MKIWTRRLSLRSDQLTGLHTLGSTKTRVFTLQRTSRPTKPRVFTIQRTSVPTKPSVSRSNVRLCRQNHVFSRSSIRPGLRELVIPILIPSNMYEEDDNCGRSCDRSCDSNMLIGSTKHSDFFAIKLHCSLCMYMHRNTLVLKKRPGKKTPCHTI